MPSRYDRKMRQYLYKGGVNGALLTDLSKASDCVLHDLLISKLEFYANVVKIPLKQKTKNKKLIMCVVSIVKFRSESHKALH